MFYLLSAAPNDSLVAFPICGTALMALVAERPNNFAGIAYSLVPGISPARSWVVVGAGMFSPHRYCVVFVVVDRLQNPCRSLKCQLYGWMPFIAAMCCLGHFGCEVSPRFIIDRATGASFCHSEVVCRECLGAGIWLFSPVSQMVDVDLQLRFFTSYQI
jgi:hypothetical protein